VLCCTPCVDQAIIREAKSGVHLCPLVTLVALAALMPLPALMPQMRPHFREGSPDDKSMRTLVEGSVTKSKVMSSKSSSTYTHLARVSVRRDAQPLEDTPSLMPCAWAEHVGMHNRCANSQACPNLLTRMHKPWLAAAQVRVQHLQLRTCAYSSQRSRPDGVGRISMVPHSWSPFHCTLRTCAHHWRTHRHGWAAVSCLPGGEHTGAR